MRIRFICIALFVTLLSTTISADPIKLDNAKPHVNVVKPNINKATSSQVMLQSAFETGDIEIITDLAGKHYWQMGITNTSNRNAENYKVYVDVEGFREEDRVPTVGIIERLEAGKTGFVRAELPDFEGMHQFRIKAGAPPRVVEIPRPFRKDANGSPAKALQIDRVWAQKVGGKIRWYMETKPNIYGTIAPGEVKLMVNFRERLKEYCHQEAFKKFGSQDHQQIISYVSPETNYMPVNTTEIKPGARMTFSGELNDSTAKPHLPSRVDRLTIEMNYAYKKSVALPESLYAPYMRCTDE